MDTVNTPADSAVPACPACGQPVAQPGEQTRTDRIYCSTRCRKRATKRVSAGRSPEDPGQNSQVCARCYSPLTANGQRSRAGQRFCSRDCQHVATMRRRRGQPEGDRLVSGDELSARINELSGTVRTLEGDLSAALERADRADSFRADADRTAREAADTVSGHADTVMRRTERADTLAAELSALTEQLNAAYRQIQTLTSERDQATAKATALSKQTARQRTPNGQGARTPLTLAAQTYAYVIQLANAYRDYANQHGGMNNMDWQRMKDLPKYREHVKTNTRTLDNYAMHLLTLYTQRFLEIKERGRNVPDFLPDVVRWRNKLNSLFTLPVTPPTTRKNYKFPAAFPKQEAKS